MNDVREQLGKCFQGSVCLIGVGNLELGDDAAGMRVSEQLLSNATLQPEQNPVPGHFCVLSCGTEPERVIGRIVRAGWDHVIFIDAVDFGGPPGAVVFLDATQMESRFPQVSTHRLSFSILAKWVEARGSTQAWLLGIQPDSLRIGTHLTAKVANSVATLTELLRSVARAALSQPATSSAAQRPGPPAASV